MKLLLTLIIFLFTVKLYAPPNYITAVNILELYNKIEMINCFEELAIHETGKIKDYPRIVNGKYYTSPYHVINSKNMKGRWQHSNIALKDIGYKGTTKQFLHNPKIQEECLIKTFKKNKMYIEYYRLTKYIGKTIHGVRITLTKMLAVYHLESIDKLIRLIKYGYVAKSGSTTVIDYLRIFGKYKFEI
jgi:hypothetical protein